MRNSIIAILFVVMIFSISLATRNAIHHYWMFQQKPEATTVTNEVIVFVTNTIPALDLESYRRAAMMNFEDGVFWGNAAFQEGKCSNIRELQVRAYEIKRESAAKGAVLQERMRKAMEADNQK